MKECEFLTMDDCPCNDLAIEKIGKRWYCLEHALLLKFEGGFCYSFTDEDEECEVDEEEFYYGQ